MATFGMTDVMSGERFTVEAETAEAAIAAHLASVGYKRIEDAAEVLGVSAEDLVEDMGVRELGRHVTRDEGRYSATQLRNGRWVAGGAYGGCPDCSPPTNVKSGHVVSDSTTTYATAAEALDAAERD